ncbi:hypothetical protein CDL12_20727 [Handroanthus impetiginosus]|uniref:Uncharacterized protein n=1 Tax=Handroanthus impetiginosus TaxID=429701 RepID=A0A2G9GNC8_9LAMI|nr:hypothetical protein CDL12_20727 [Handroanthus impetiginosus]
MAKVHPHVNTISTSSKQEVFTLWMKSLILSSNGCTIFDSNGKIVYRVDNYDQKCSNLVHVMDFTGKLLFTIVKKKFYVFRLWEGYRSSGKDVHEEKPGFRVKKIMGIIQNFLRFSRGCSLYKVMVGLDGNKPCDYVMESGTGKSSSCKILDNLGGLVAEVKRKITPSGVVLGEEVLKMVVEPNVDHSLIVGLVVVFGLIHHKL